MAEDALRPPTRAGNFDTVRSDAEVARAGMADAGEVEGGYGSPEERLGNRLDLVRTVRERPVATLGVLFGAGLLLGLLTGGGEKERAPSARRARHERPAKLWERRARRLRRVAREQEAELARLRGRPRPVEKGDHEGIAAIIRRSFERVTRGSSEG